MEIVKCTLDDCEQLAVLNKQLIEDEKHESLMSVEELKQRMKEFLRSGYQAVYFMEKNNIIGYGLVKTNVFPYYLRHFFICRDYRKRGHGRQAFSKLLDYLCTNTVDIEVLSWNQTGKSFWESLGFKPRHIGTRIKH